MGLRRTSSLNVIRLGSTLAPDGVAVFRVLYVRESPNGTPVESDPGSVRVEVRRPDGTTLIAHYPSRSTDSREVSVTRILTGNYAVQVYLSSMAGRWQLKVITDDGDGPSEEVGFQVVPAT
jgi:hypothetical protein